MRLPRFRFTIWRMMILVAVAAVPFAYEHTVERRDDFRFWAMYHRQERDACRGYLDGTTVLCTGGDGKTTYRRMVPTGPDPYIADARSRGFGVELLDRTWLERQLAYRTAMTAKYERAVRYPWLPIAPDPPEPK